MCIEKGKNLRLILPLAFLFLVGCAAPTTKVNTEKTNLASKLESNAAILGKKPEQAWVRPEFQTGDGILRAGTAFVIKKNQVKLLITAHHLFGLAGGLERNYSGKEIPQLVSGVHGVSPFEGIYATADQPIAVNEAREMQNTDLAIFPLLENSRIHALSLSKRLPKIGEKVWLIGEVQGSPEYKHLAIVEEASPNEIYYRFVKPIKLRATSGAPVISQDGKVIAMQLGGGKYEGNIFGVGNPAIAIDSLIETAIKDRR